MITIKTYMRSKDDDGLNEYIESLENYFTELEASNTNRLIFKLDELNGAIADDVQKIIDNEAYEYFNLESICPITGEATTERESRSALRVLNDEKDSKVFDRVMTLYSKLASIKTVSEYITALTPSVDNEDKRVSLSKSVKLEKGKNPFESISKQLQKDKTS